MKLKINDIVRVINDGEQYPSTVKVMEELGFEDLSLDRDSIDATGQVGVVFGIENSGFSRIAVRFKDYELLYGIEGLEKSKKPSKKAI